MVPRKKPAPDPNPGAPVSMADLARELGVSMTTISRALSDHHSIGPEMKAKVLKLAKKYHYQPNRLASALRKGRSKLLGIIVPYIEGRFFPAVVHGIETAASRAGYHVIICQSSEDEAQERRNVEALLNAQVAGIMVSVARTTTHYQHFAKVRGRGLPLVFFDRSIAGDDVNAVVLNDREGALLSTRHLLAQGCRRIAHLAGPQHLSIYQHRRQGYLDALREAGQAADETLIAYTRHDPGRGRRGPAPVADAARPARRRVRGRRLLRPGRHAGGPAAGLPGARRRGPHRLQQRGLHRHHRAYYHHHRPAVRGNGPGHRAPAAGAD